MAYARVRRTTQKPRTTESHVAGRFRGASRCRPTFSQSTAAWPLDPARFHRGIETWTVVGGDTVLDLATRAARRHILSQLTRGRLCYSILRDESRAAYRVNLQILRRARFEPRKSSPSVMVVSRITHGSYRIPAYIIPFHCER